MDIERLTRMVEEGLSQRQIAAELGCSQGRIRYWLNKADLATRGSQRVTGERLRPDEPRVCSEHGETLHYFERSGRLRCRACLVETTRRRRQQLKADLVEYKGGVCEDCGFDTHQAALRFDHRDPATKVAKLGRLISANSRKRAFAEVEECDLVCANCHAIREADRHNDGLAA